MEQSSVHHWNGWVVAVGLGLHHRHIVVGAAMMSQIGCIPLLRCELLLMSLCRICGRLSTSWPTSPELSDSGKMVKSFALEEVVYVPERRLLYEFGGASAVTDLLSSGGQVGTTPYTTSNAAASRDPPQLDSSGSVAGADVAWASYQGEQFMDQVR